VISIQHRTTPSHHPQNQGSIIKQIAARATPASISLAGGIPLDSTFIFESVEASCPPKTQTNSWAALIHITLGCCTPFFIAHLDVAHQHQQRID